MNISPKVSGGGFAGAIVLIVQWCVDAFTPVHAPEYVWTAVLVIVSTIVAWAIPDKHRDLGIAVADAATSSVIGTVEPAVAGTVAGTVTEPVAEPVATPGVEYPSDDPRTVPASKPQETPIHDSLDTH